MTERPETIAARIKAAPKGAVRHIRRAYCPRDGRLVAATVVFEGHSYLWLVGGRSGSNLTMIAEWDQSISDARAAYEGTLKRVADGVVTEQAAADHLHACRTGNGVVRGN